MVENISHILENFGIKYSSIENTLFCPESIVISVVVNESRIYFKFINKSNIQRIKKEIEVVRYLKANNVKVYEYFDIEGNSIFVGDEFCLYGSYDAGSPIDLEGITKDFILKCIKNIANMHKTLVNFPMDTSNYAIESDDERFFEFYTNNIEFFKQYNLVDYVKNQIQFQKFKSNYIYIHSDLNFRNITNNGTIIDFTDMKVGYREDDLGKFFQNILNTKYCSNKELDEYIKLYERVSNSKINKNRLKFSIVYRLIFRFYMSLKESNNTDEYEHLVVALEKLKNWEDCITNDKRSCLQNN